jgi:hypothetical protein
MVTVVLTAAATVAPCCGSVATAMLRGGSPVVAALPAARGALDERCLMGTDASDLSALAGASVGAVSATLRTRKQKTELQPLEAGTSGGATAYLKVEKPRFLFLEGLADAAMAPVTVATTLLDASAARTGASAARAVSSTDRPVAGASAPTTGARSSAALTTLGDGRGIPPLGGSPPPITLLFFLLLRRVLRGRRGEGGAPAAHAACTPRSAAPGAPATGCSSPSGAQPAPAPVTARRGWLLEPGAWAGLTVTRPWSLSARKNDLSGSHQRVVRE